MTQFAPAYPIAKNLADHKPGSKLGLNYVQAWGFELAAYLFALAAFFFNVANIEYTVAGYGFSPIVYVLQNTRPELLNSSFPLGIELFGTSIYYHLYLWMDKYLGISALSSMYVLSLSQFLFFVYAAFHFIRSYFKEFTGPLALAFVVVAFGSQARDCNFAFYTTPVFSQPYYHYILVDALRLLAVSFFARQRYCASGASLALTFAVSPTHALPCALLLACLALFDAKLGFSMLLKTSLSFILPSLCWYLSAYQGLTAQTESVSASDWLAFTRTFSVHLYPVLMGVFSSSFIKTCLPFGVFFCLLAFSRMSREGSPMTRGIWLGLLAVTGLSLAGILISQYSSSVFMLKLSLHRANELVLLAGLPFVLHALLAVWGHGTWWGAFLAAAVLSSLFLPGQPWPLVPCLGLCLLGRNGSDGAKQWLAPFGLTLLGAGALLLPDVFVEGPEPGRLCGSLAALGAGLAGTLAFFRLSRQGGRINLAACLMAGLGILWLTVQGSMLYTNKDKDILASYREAQVWAKRSTVPGSLFMVPPSWYGYGWPDFSERPSFGVAHQWLLSSWLYNSDNKVFANGVSRVQEFIPDINTYLGGNSKSRGEAYLNIGNVMNTRYFKFDDGWHAGLARKYGISFFVFPKHNLSGIENLQNEFVIVHENDHIIIASPRHL